MEKKNIIILGLKILEKFGDENFIIYLKATKMKLKDYSDYISKYRNGYILELWENRKHIAQICKLKGCL